MSFLIRATFFGRQHTYSRDYRSVLFYGCERWGGLVLVMVMRDVGVVEGCVCLDLDLELGLGLGL